MEEACVATNEANRWRSASTAKNSQRYYFCKTETCPAYTKKGQDNQSHNWLGGDWINLSGLNPLERCMP